MALTILITGFGPFPTAPFNPTERLVRRLARIRRPALADVRLVPHVFATSYQAVDRDLPRLIIDHRPDAILMFGLAARRRVVTVETRARNAVSALLADAGRTLAQSQVIARNQPPALPFAPSCRMLMQPIRAAGVPAKLSRDAGRYVCNYLCWRALEAARVPGGPRFAAFVHVPLVPRGPVRGRRAKQPRVTQGDLLRAGGRLLLHVAAAVRR